jgi:hypothetical protein
MLILFSRVREINIEPRDKMSRCSKNPLPEGGKSIKQEKGGNTIKKYTIDRFVFFMVRYR